MEGRDSVDSGEIEVVSLRRESLRDQDQRSPSLHARTPRRRLIVTLGCALALILATSGLLISTQSDPHAALARLLGIPSPTPTATLALGGAVFLVEHRVPWGVLTIDGKKNDVLDIAQAADSDLLDSPVSFLLNRGRHQVVYIAPPFAPLRCVVSVPAAIRDTCPLVVPDAQLQRLVIGAARILDLRATVDRLPAQPLADLTAAAAAAVGVSTPTVGAAPGDHYLGTDTQTHTFTQDMRVRLFREPWQGPPPDGQGNCRFLCPGISGSGASAGIWTLTAEVREGYHYAPLAASAPALADGPLDWTSDSFKQPPGPFLDSVPLEVTWDGSWHVTADALNAQPLVCRAATTDMGNFGADSGPANVVPQFNPLPAANQADGCAIGIQTFNPDGSKGATGALLYRFGTLLTTDVTSHALFPYLPAANSREQTLAHQILAQAH